jgi:hypothetical protein
VDTAYPSYTRYTYIAVPNLAASWTFQAVDESGKTRLQIQSGAGMQGTLSDLAFRAPDGTSVTVTVADKQVQVQGAGLQARADRLTRSGTNGTVLTFEGNVKLRYEKKERHAEVVAERAVVNLAAGQVEISIGGAKVAPPLPEPVPPVCPTPSYGTTIAPPAQTKGAAKDEQLFSSWIGRFR